MGMTVDDLIVAPSRGTQAEAKAYARVGNAYVIWDVDDYIDAVYALCIPDDFPDASIVIAQSVHETDTWRSHWWERRLNPAGMGITGDPVQNLQSPDFETGEEAARAHVSHLLVYALGPADAGSLWFRRTGWSIRDDDPRYDAYVAAYGNTAQAETIAGLAGTWATDPAYAGKVCARGNAVYQELPDQQGGTVPDYKIPTIVLDAGHRSTDRSGNPAETALTDDLAIAYTAELRQRGFEAFWYQRDIDRDSDPDETIGTLNTVAKGLGAWLQSQSWALMLSLHYDGARSVLHAIVPDNVGLSTAYPEGRDPNDTAANNPLDRRLGVAIVDRMVRAGLGSPFHGSLGETGLMSERETGVGRQGYRLAVMSATAPSRVKAVRLVIEHGGTSDPAARRFSDFARAAADAIESVYGTPGGTTTTTTTAPPVTYPPKRVPAPDVIESQGYPLTINKPNRFYCTQGGHFKTAPSLDAPDATPTPYKANRRYTFDYAAVVDGEDWLVSKAGSWAPAKNFEE
jgi:hypothetical protein